MEIVELTHSDGEHIRFLLISSPELEKLKEKYEPRGFYFNRITTYACVPEWMEE